MHPPEYNLDLVQAMLQEMDDFLLAPETFWPLKGDSSPADPPFPRLSMGVLLLTMDELVAQKESMSPSQLSRFQKLSREVEAIRRKWRVATERKAAQELRMRFNLWRAYLQDLEAKKEEPDRYDYEVRQRVIFQRLTTLAARQETAQPLLEEIQTLDAALRSYFLPGEFIWEDPLRPLYPQQPYWFLYGRPRPR